jgi:hypothetical protein
MVVAIVALLTAAGLGVVVYGMLQTITSKDKMIADLQAENSSLRQQIATSEKGMAELRSQIAAAQAATIAAEKKMPVTLAYRRAQVGPGLVLQLRNTSNRYLEVILKRRNPTLKTQDSYDIKLPPNEVKEFGWLEKITFVSGDELTIEHADYTTLHATIP